jgi:4'-phosphopantetheinyl transferase EntD
MIERILPATVACADSTVDPLGVRLFPAEEAVITRAATKRRQEFTTARHCARQALAALGEPAAPILPGAKGEPCWPPGVVGSMTHCAGYRAAALARTSDIRTLGIDAEPHEPLPAGVLTTIGLPAERDALADLRRTAPGVHWDRLLFSAKESVYKAWFPLAKCWLDFEEALLRLDPDGVFHARLLVPGPSVDGRPLTGFTGRWLVTDGLVLTAIALSGGSE